MSQLDAFDYSWSRPDPATMATAGVKAVGRYLWDGGKGVTVPEIKALWAAGIGVWLGYEADSGNHLLGAAQGTKDGADARRILAELSEIVPTNWPIYFACDQQVSAQMTPVVLAYLTAANAQAPGASCYAQKSVCDAWKPGSWQTLAWSDGQISANAVIYQWAIEQNFHGSDVDYNQLMNASAAGILWPPGHIPEGGGTVLQPPTTKPKAAADMSQAFLVPGKNADGTPSNRWWIVAVDHSTRVQCLDIANAQALAGSWTDGKPFINAAMTYGEMQQIPDATYHDSANHPAGS